MSKVKLKRRNFRGEPIEIDAASPSDIAEVITAHTLVYDSHNALDQGTYLVAAILNLYRDSYGDEAGRKMLTAMGIEMEEIDE